MTRRSGARRLRLGQLGQPGQGRAGAGGEGGKGLRRPPRGLSQHCSPGGSLSHACRWPLEAPRSLRRERPRREPGRLSRCGNSQLVSQNDVDWKGLLKVT